MHTRMFVNLMVGERDVKNEQKEERLSFETKIYMTLLFICGLATVVKFISQVMADYSN